MRKSTKFLGALAVAGLVAAGGSAFTASGLENNAPTSVFVGGSATQGVSGGSLESIVYTYQDAPANEKIASFLVTFANVAAAVEPSFTQVGGTAGGACTAVADVTFTSTCTITTPAVGVSSVTIIVPSA